MRRRIGDCLSIPFSSSNATVCAERGARCLAPLLDTPTESATHAESKSPALAATAAARARERMDRLNATLLSPTGKTTIIAKALPLTRGYRQRPGRREPRYGGW